MKVEVAAQGSPSLIVLIVSVDLKQHCYSQSFFKAPELCRSRGGRPGLLVRDTPYIIVSVDEKQHCYYQNFFRAQELCESQGGRPGLLVSNSPYSFCGLKATLLLSELFQSFFRAV